MKRLIVDPPSGWMYGFPKPYPDGVQLGDDEAFCAWLLKEGYPEEMLDLAVNHSRYWEHEVDE